MVESKDRTSYRDFCIYVPAMPGSCFEIHGHKLDQHLMGQHKKEHRVHKNNKNKNECEFIPRSRVCDFMPSIDQALPSISKY